jgi:uncharacterized protein (TIGR02466 family)
MIESKILGIFPTPVYISELNRPLTIEENSFIEKTKLDVHNNEGNKTSNDNYILNNKAFKDIKQELNLRVQDYFDKIISTTNNITPYITQSWLNYTETNQYHHKHAHSNSLISGVFYIDCNKEYDKILFYKNSYNPIKLDTKEFNEFNSESWYVEVNTGQIVLFPSFLEHMVDIKKGSNTRISLAFNVFVKGTLGNKRSLTELILNNY